MHQRPPGPFTARLRAVSTWCAGRLLRRSGRLLAATVALAAVAATFALLPRVGTGSTTPAASPALAVDATSRTQPIPAHGAAGAATGTGAGADAAGHSTAAAEQAGLDGRWHESDHRRQREQPAAQQATNPNPDPNPNCTIIVPADPTSAAGLVTPYELTATDGGDGACHEANADQSAFVEAAVFDPDTHSVSIYHPLVVDRHDRPAVPPVPVTLPAKAVVGVWFGFNGDTLTLAGPGARQCVNGLPGSPFGQFAYCNAAAFFQAAHADSTFEASIPALGTVTKGAATGRPCPTTRDFAVVDQDQSDNLATAYRIVDGRMAQLTATTRTLGTPLTNGSDEGLLANRIDPALGCTPFTAPDLTDGNRPTAALALNELSAAKLQASPAALVPESDPMAKIGADRLSSQKTDLYRVGVDQPALPTGQTPEQYCADIAAQAPGSLRAAADVLGTATSPSPDFPDLLGFLVDRLQASVQNLGCGQAVADAVTTALGPLVPRGTTADGATTGTSDATTPTGSGAGSSPGTDQPQQGSSGANGTAATTAATPALATPPPAVGSPTDPTGSAAGSTAATSSGPAATTSGSAAAGTSPSSGG